jgi:hypothetical protein
MAGNQPGPVDFDHMPLAQQAQRRVDLADQPGDRRLAGAGVAAEHQVQRNRRRPPAVQDPTLVGPDQSDQATDLRFHPIEADQPVQTLQRTFQVVGGLGFGAGDIVGKQLAGIGLRLARQALGLFFQDVLEQAPDCPCVAEVLVAGAVHLLHDASDPLVCRRCDPEMMLLQQPVEDCLERAGVVIAKLDVAGEAGLQPRVGGDELLHRPCVTGNDHGEPVAAVLHGLEQGVDGFLTEVVVALRKRVGLIDEQDAAIRLPDRFERLRCGMANVTCNQGTAIGLDDVPLFEQTELTVYPANQTGHRRLAGTGVAAEHHVQRNRRNWQALCPPALLDAHQIDQLAHFRLDVFQADKRIQFGQGIAIGFGIGRNGPGGCRVQPGQALPGHHRIAHLHAMFAKDAVRRAGNFQHHLVRFQVEQHFASPHQVADLPVPSVLGDGRAAGRGRQFRRPYLEAGASGRSRLAGCSVRRGIRRRRCLHQYRIVAAPGHDRAGGQAIPDFGAGAIAAQDVVRRIVFELAGVDDGVRTGIADLNGVVAAPAEAVCADFRLRSLDHAYGARRHVFDQAVHDQADGSVAEHDGRRVLAAAGNLAGLEIQARVAEGPDAIACGVVDPTAAQPGRRFRFGHLDGMQPTGADVAVLRLERGRTLDDGGKLRILD